MRGREPPDGRMWMSTLSVPARVLAAGVAAAALAVLPRAAEAQDYPSRNVRLVVGFSAGGPTDIPARFIADKLAPGLGKPVVVENRPGAGSMLGIQEVLAQPRDGHTILACTTYDPINTALYRKARYTVADIAPVTLFARYDYGMTVRLDGPVQSVPDLLSYGKANPGTLNWGILGIGAPQNLVAKQLEKATGVKVTTVPFKGSNEAVAEVAAKRLDIFMGPPISVMPLVESGHVKLIAATGKSRLTSAPGVATLSEAGVPIVAYAWLGICAGAGTPAPIIERLNTALKPILLSAEYKTLIEKSGSVPLYSTPQEMQAVIDETVRTNAPTIEEFKLQLD